MTRKVLFNFTDWQRLSITMVWTEVQHWNSIWRTVDNVKIIVIYFMLWTNLAIQTKVASSKGSSVREMMLSALHVRLMLLSSFSLDLTRHTFSSDKYPSTLGGPKWCFEIAVQSHGGKEGLNIFHLSENVEAEREKSFTEIVPSQGILFLAASLKSISLLWTVSTDTWWCSEIARRFGCANARWLLFRLCSVTIPSDSLAPLIGFEFGWCLYGSVPIYASWCLMSSDFDLNITIWNGEEFWVDFCYGCGFGLSFMVLKEKLLEILGL